MADTVIVKPHHSIIDIDFSNSSPWQQDRRNIVVKAFLGIPELKKVSMQVDIISAGGTQKALLSQTDFTADTKREYSVAFAELALGVNTVIVTFQDEVPPDGGDGKTVFQYDVIMENRDSFAIKRRFAFSDEYLISGPLTIDPINGVQLKTEAGLEEGIIVPVNAIQMDGRAKIKKITVTGDADKLGDVSANRTATYREDRGDSVLQRLPLSDLRTFKAISKIQMIDNV